MIKDDAHKCTRVIEVAFGIHLLTLNRLGVPADLYREYISSTPKTKDCEAQAEAEKDEESTATFTFKNLLSIFALHYILLAFSVIFLVVETFTPKNCAKDWFDERCGKGCAWKLLPCCEEKPKKVMDEELNGICEENGVSEKVRMWLASERILKPEDLGALASTEDGVKIMTTTKALRNASGKKIKLGDAVAIAKAWQTCRRRLGGGAEAALPQTRVKGDTGPDVEAEEQRERMSDVHIHDDFSKQEKKDETAS